MIRATFFGLLVVLLGAMACGSSAATQPTPTAQGPTPSAGAAPSPTQEGIVADKRTIKPDVQGEGTPIAKAGTPAVAAFPDHIGTCKIEPKSNCEGADMRGADLAAYRAQGFQPPVYADLRGANLRNADLTGADLERARLDGIDLRSANLTDANLTMTTMFEADLRGANLTGTNMSFADLEDALLEGAIFCRTTMPDGTVNNEGCP